MRAPVCTVASTSAAATAVGTEPLKAAITEPPEALVDAVACLSSGVPSASVLNRERTLTEPSAVMVEPKLMSATTSGDSSASATEAPTAAPTATETPRASAFAAPSATARTSTSPAIGVSSEPIAAPSTAARTSGATVAVVPDAETVRMSMPPASANESAVALLVSVASMVTLVATGMAPSAAAVVSPSITASALETPMAAMPRPEAMPRDRASAVCAVSAVMATSPASARMTAASPLNASTTLPMVALASAPAPAPPMPMETDVATASVSMSTVDIARTPTSPVVAVTAASMDARTVVVTVLSVSDRPTDAPMRPNDRAPEPTSDSILASSVAATVTPVAPVTTAPSAMVASMVLLIVLMASAPPPASAREKSFENAPEIEAAMAKESMDAVSSSGRFAAASTTTWPAVDSTVDPAMLPRMVLPMTFSALTPAMATATAA
jgi:hypothetical protein